MFRQIIVFTKSPSLPSNQGLTEAASQLRIPLRTFNPFQDLFWDTAPGDLPPSEADSIDWGTIGKEDLILLRTSGILFDDIDLYIGEELAHRGAKLHCPISALFLLRNKNQQALWLARQNLPHVKTLIKTGPLSKRELESWHQSIEYVVKSIRGNKGIGLRKFSKEDLLTFWEELQKGTDQRYLIQPFFGDGREVRHLVLGKHHYFIEKRPGVDWRRNAEFSTFEAASLTHQEEASLLENAKKIQEGLKTPTFAIDYLLISGKWEILEINANPGLDTANKLFEDNLFEVYLKSFTNL